MRHHFTTSILASPLIPIWDPIPTMPPMTPRLKALSGLLSHLSIHPSQTIPFCTVNCLLRWRLKKNPPSARRSRFSVPPRHHYPHAQWCRASLPSISTRALSFSSFSIHIYTEGDCYHSALHYPFVMEDNELMRICSVGGNPVSAFLSWRLQATNACDVTLVWKSGYEHVAQYGISFKYVGSAALSFVFSYRY